MPSWEGKTRGGVMGYRIFIWILKYTGLSFAYFLLSFVVIYFIFTSKKAVRSIYLFNKRIMKFSTQQAMINVYRNYHIFGQILLDKIAMLADFQQRFTFNFEGEEYLRQMDNGGLLISAHIGNWEIAGQLLNRLEKRINIILFDAEHQKIKGFLSEKLSRRNVNFIIIRDDFSHLAEIRQALANKEIIAMHGDRFIEGNKTMELDFMGHAAQFPVGPVNMAARFGVPVSYVYAVKETHSHYHFYATPLYRIPFSGNLQKRDQAFRDALKIYVQSIEKVLRKYPCQWFNYYDFWNLDKKAA